MTMTDTEAKALALVLVNADNDCNYLDYYTVPSSYLRVTLERSLEREARHAAELRELKERFSEACLAVKANYDGLAFPTLTPFILPAPDPLVEAMVGAWPQYADRMEACNNDAKALCAALAARGGKIVWEAGE